jgi:hypothetical protein
LKKLLIVSNLLLALLTMNVLDKGNISEVSKIIHFEVQDDELPFKH